MSAHYVLPQTARAMMKLSHPDGGRIATQINHWVVASGAEWTVKRLKSLRAAALQLRAGNHEVVIKIYQEESISYTKNDLLPRGPFRNVVGEFLQAERPIALRRLDVILRAYTAIRLNSLSHAQYRKSIKSITGKYTGTDEALVRANRLIKAGAVWLQLPVKARLKRSSIHRLKSGTSTHCEGRLPQDLAKLPYGRLAWSLVTSCATSEDLLGDTPQADGFRRLCVDGGADETTPGHIAFIQEKGAKARVVAVPTAWNQWLFEPLHTWLDGLARDLQCSAVHDQNKGAWFIQENLGATRLFCYDLSSATDRFPRSVQIQLLSYLNLDRYADALELACHGWQVTAPPYESMAIVDYEVGQPMGLYGSFPLFHLTHCCLLAGIAVESGCSDPSGSFLVLGDDVLIRDSKVAETYHALLCDLGVDISDTKSINSDRVAEFAGFVGAVTRHGVTAYRPFKHDDRGIVNNPIGVLNSLGKRVLHYPAWGKWLRAFERTRWWRLPDLSPLVPDDDIGGINPRMISPERFANLLHQASLVALDPESLEYVSPEFEYSEDWKDIMEELFDEQPSKKEFSSLTDFLRSSERHGEQDEKPEPSRKGSIAVPPVTLRHDPILQIQECGTRLHPADEADEDRTTGPDFVEKLRKEAEELGRGDSSTARHG